MATRNDNKRRNVRTFAGEMPPLLDIKKPGTRIVGCLQSARRVMIHDRETNREKEVWQYTFRLENGRKGAILGRTMLDAAMQDAFDSWGGIDQACGNMFVIERGKNTALDGDRELGTYTVTTWEE